MAIIFPDFDNISRLKVPPTEGELALLHYLAEKLDDNFEIFFNSYLDGDRPDIIILRQGHGALIIEVKDWRLAHYQVDSNNNWHVATPANNALIRSPHQQVFRYKANMFELHIPVLGLKEAVNRAFFNVIDVCVYFHHASHAAMRGFYDDANQKIKQETRLNNEKFIAKEITFVAYEKQANYLKRKAQKLTRDLAMSLTPDTLDKRIAALKIRKPNPIFSDEIYQDLKRRLAPPEEVKIQGIKVNLDKKQLRLADSKSVMTKLKGVAGCGKTTILAQRAVNSHLRHNSTVLILTYNLTLKPFIKDKISRIRGSIGHNLFEVTNYHQFFNACLNELNISIESIVKQSKASGAQLFDLIYQHGEWFKDKETRRYQTILIDEIQDYEAEWVKIIRDYFLAEDGEMVLFGDLSQNIYQRDDNKRESSITKGFGSWEKLTKSYRSQMDTPLINLFKSFQTEYLLKKYQDSEIFEAEPSQGSMNFDLLQYSPYPALNPTEAVFHQLNTIIRENGLHPNDIVIICSSIEWLIKINSLINHNEKTMVTFETESERQALRTSANDEASYIEERDKLRRRKKNFFMQNSGLIKLSTTHSFKGMEAKTAFVVLTKEDDAELVYTAITRAKNNLIIFGPEDDRYRPFFQGIIG